MLGAPTVFLDNSTLVRKAAGRDWYWDAGGPKCLVSGVISSVPIRVLLLKLPVTFIIYPISYSIPSLLAFVLTVHVRTLCSLVVLCSPPRFRSSRSSSSRTPALVRNKTSFHNCPLADCNEASVRRVTISDRWSEKETGEEVKETKNQQQGTRQEAMGIKRSSPSHCGESWARSSKRVHRKSRSGKSPRQQLEKLIEGDTSCETLLAGKGEEEEEGTKKERSFGGILNFTRWVLRSCLTSFRSHSLLIFILDGRSVRCD
jgi:hypothetical protein